MLLEICVDSPESASVAQAGGAGRIELCSHLDCGGLTPSAGLLQSVRELITIPLQVLIRPRAGDFCYTEKEFEVMQRDIRHAKEAGADGVVLGILLPDGKVDFARTRQLVEAARPLSVTFHRAFDFARDPNQALEDVIGTGADRILTSGQHRTVMEGIPLIKKLLTKAAGRIIIMPGAGINSTNVQFLIANTAAMEIHLSASKPYKSSMQYRKRNLSLSSSNASGYSQRQIDAQELRKIRNITL